MTSILPLPLSAAFPADLSVDFPRDDRLLRRQLWTRWRRLLEGQKNRSTPLGPRARQSPLFDPLLKLFHLGMGMIGQDVRGRRALLSVRAVDHTLICPGLPMEFEGVRILHITDPHFDLHPALPEAIGQAAAALPADICVLTGDYRAGMNGPHGAALSGLRRMLPQVRAPEGIWATLGNHDACDMVEPLEAMGVTPLINEARTLRRQGAPLRLVGLDDVHRFYTPLAQEALEVHAPNTDGVFSILLVHSPELATTAARRGYGVYLCGHTHAGQICLPGGRPLVTHLDSHHHLSRGLWRIHGMHGYTSPGAGGSGIPLRFFSQSEVTRFTLRRPRPTGLL